MIVQVDGDIAGVADVAVACIDVSTQHHAAGCGRQLLQRTHDGSNIIAGVVGDGGHTTGIAGHQVENDRITCGNGRFAGIADLGADVVVTQHVDDDVLTHGGVAATSDDRHTVGDVEGTCVDHDGVAVGHVDATGDVTLGDDAAVEDTAIDGDLVAATTGAAVGTHDEVVGGSVGTAVDHQLTGTLRIQSSLHSADVTVTVDGQGSTVVGLKAPAGEGDVVIVQVDGDVAGVAHVTVACIDVSSQHHTATGCFQRVERVDLVGHHALDLEIDLGDGDTVVVDDDRSSGSGHEVLGDDHFLDHDLSGLLEDDVGTTLDVDGGSHGLDILDGTVVELDSTGEVQAARSGLQVDGRTVHVGGDVLDDHVAIGGRQGDALAGRNDTVRDGDGGILAVGHQRQATDVKRVTGQVDGQVAARFGHADDALGIGDVGIQGSTTRVVQDAEHSLQRGGRGATRDGLAADGAANGDVPSITAHDGHTGDGHVTDILVGVGVVVGHAAQEVGALGVELQVGDGGPLLAIGHGGHSVTTHDPLTIQGDVVGVHFAVGIDVAGTDVELVGAVDGDVLSGHDSGRSDGSVGVAIPVVGDEPSIVLTVEGAVDDGVTIGDELNLTILHVLGGAIHGEVVGELEYTVGLVEHGHEGHGAGHGDARQSSGLTIHGEGVLGIVVGPLLGEVVCDALGVGLGGDNVGGIGDGGTKGDVGLVQRVAIAHKGDEEADDVPIGVQRHTGGDILDGGTGRDVVGQAGIPTCKGVAVQGGHGIGDRHVLTTEGVVHDRGDVGGHVGVVRMAGRIVGKVHAVHSGGHVAVGQVVAVVAAVHQEAVALGGALCSVGLTCYVVDGIGHHGAGLQGNATDVLGHVAQGHCRAIVAHTGQGQLDGQDGKRCRIAAGRIVVGGLGDAGFDVVGAGILGHKHLMLALARAIIIERVHGRDGHLGHLGVAAVYQSTVVIHILGRHGHHGGSLCNGVGAIILGHDEVGVAAQGDDDIVHADIGIHGGRKGHTVILDGIGVIDRFAGALHYKAGHGDGLLTIDARNAGRTDGDGGAIDGGIQRMLVVVGNGHHVRVGAAVDSISQGQTDGEVVGGGISLAESDTLGVRVVVLRLDLHHRHPVGQAATGNDHLGFAIVDVIVRGEELTEVIVTRTTDDQSAGHLGDLVVFKRAAIGGQDSLGILADLDSLLAASVVDIDQRRVETNRRQLLGGELVAVGELVGLVEVVGACASVQSGLRAGVLLGLLMGH